jgi:hypothetical protein
MKLTFKINEKPKVTKMARNRVKTSLAKITDVVRKLAQSDPFSN